MTIQNLKKYVKEKSTLKGASLYKVYSSFSMLEAIDLMIDDYFEEGKEDKGGVLLDVFGLLQGFFVAVDALYDLSISLTKFKYSVNINQNPVLHELKFIRNDIVGHPTNRTYPDGSVGFSIFNEEKLTKYELTYSTYYFKGQEMTLKERTVDFKKLANEYHIEKNDILRELESHLTSTVREESYLNLIIDSFNKLERGLSLSCDIFDEIKEIYRSLHGNSVDSKNRFYWRIKLITLLLDWDEPDLELKEMISYMLKIQILKLYKIGLEIEDKTALIPYVKIPNILRQFFKFVRQNEIYGFEYLKNLNNIKHPFFESDLNALYSFGPNSRVAKLLIWLEKSRDGDKVFLIGSTLSSYIKKIV